MPFNCRSRLLASVPRLARKGKQSDVVIFKFILCQDALKPSRVAAVKCLGADKFIFQNLFSIGVGRVILFDPAGRRSLHARDERPPWGKGDDGISAVAYCALMKDDT